MAHGEHASTNLSGLWGLCPPAGSTAQLQVRWSLKTPREADSTLAFMCLMVSKNGSCGGFLDILLPYFMVASLTLTDENWKFWTKLVILDGRKMKFWTACLFSPYTYYATRNGYCSQKMKNYCIHTVAYIPCQQLVRLTSLLGLQFGVKTAGYLFHNYKKSKIINASKIV